MNSIKHTDSKKYIELINKNILQEIESKTTQKQYKKQKNDFEENEENEVQENVLEEKINKVNVKKYADINENNQLVEHYIEMRKMLEIKINFFKNRKNQTHIIEKIDDLLQFINSKLMACCRHNYIYDYIDITPDRSEQICYCKTCWCTFPVK